MCFCKKISFLFMLFIMITADLIYSQSYYDKEPVVVGSDNNYPPFEFINKDYIPEGFSIDIVRAAARTMGINIEFSLEPWAETKAAFDSGKIDMLSGMYYSDERAEKYLFSSPYMVMHQAVFSRNNSPEYNDIDSLKGKEIIVQKGDIMHEYLLSKKITDKIVTVESPDQALSLLSSGKHDFVLTSRITGLYWLEELGIKNISSGSNITSVDYCFAVPENNPDLLNKLNEALIIIKKTGVYDDIYKKWFADLDPDLSSLRQSLKIIFISASILALGLIFFVLWSWKLKKTVIIKTSELKDEIDGHSRDAEELEESRELYETLFSESAEAVILVDAESREILKFNKNASDLLGITQEEFSRISFNDIFEFGDKEKLFEHFNRILTEKYDSFETSVRSKDGDIKYIIVKSKLIKIKNREIIQNIWIDITEKKIIDEKLRHSGKLEAIGTLAGGIAHDFNNILTAILGYSEVAKMVIGENNPGWDEIGEMQKAGERAKDIVRQILLFSRKDTPEKEVFNLSEIIDEIKILLRSVIPNSIKMINESDSSVDNIYANRTQIGQIFINICSNASHAMEETGGTLTIKIQNAVRQDVKYVLLKISDTGPGIDKKIAGRIFDPYFTTKEIGKGSGLGLSVVHGIVEENNGFIEFENIPGEGVSFFIYLPSCSNKSIPRIKDDYAVDIAGGNETIMVLDDEKPIIDIVSKYLQSGGYSVISENESNIAVQSFIKNKEIIDMIITDQVMPELSGLEFAEIVKKNKNIPVLLMTGYSEKLHTAGLNEEYVDKLLFKPVSRKELLNTVRNMLDKSSI